jgi:hypothetical protein
MLNNTEEDTQIDKKILDEVVCKTLKALFRIRPSPIPGFTRSNEIKCPGWQRLYVRGHTKDKIVFANISLSSDLRGNKIFTRIVKELKRRGVPTFVENPQELLAEFCELHNIPIIR